MFNDLNRTQIAAHRTGLAGAIAVMHRTGMIAEQRKRVLRLPVQRPACLRHRRLPGQLRLASAGQKPHVAATFATRVPSIISRISGCARCSEGETMHRKSAPAAVAASPPIAPVI